MRLLAALLLLGSAHGFVCPPTATEAIVLKGENEECGGACDSSGLCAEGLKCVTPKTSPMSFAILLAPSRVGKCQRPMVEEVEAEEAKEVKKDRRLAGGISDVALDDEGVVAAAKFATSYIQGMANSLPKPSLKGIVSAKKQVVAGMKYTLGLRFSDGHVHRITIVDTPWMTPRYSVQLFEPNALD